MPEVHVAKVTEIDGRPSMYAYGRRIICVKDGTLDDPRLLFDKIEKTILKNEYMWTHEF